MLKIRLWGHKKPTICKHAVHVVYPLSDDELWSTRKHRWLHTGEMSVIKCKLAMDAVESGKMKHTPQKDDYVPCLCPHGYNEECARYEPVKEPK